MIEYNELFSEIDRLENEFKKISEDVVDFNSPDWMNFSKTSDTLSTVLNDQLNDIRTSVINLVINSNEKTIDSLRNKILSSENVLNKIKLPISRISTDKENIKNSFTNALVLEALIGPEPDARDVMLELADLIKFAKKHGFDYKQVFQEVLKYSSDSKKNEFGSMKSILMNFINGSF